MKNKSLLIFIGAVLMASVLAGPAHSFKEADKNKLLTTKECQWCDLHGIDLTGVDLTGVNLASANLSGAKLVRTNLTSANLAGTYLRNANLTDANLTNAFLNKASLHGADIGGVNWTGTDLSHATWIDGSKCIDQSIGECKSARLF